jgi:hypothetical protein
LLARFFLRDSEVFARFFGDLDDHAGDIFAIHKTPQQLTSGSSCGINGGYLAA